MPKKKLTFEQALGELEKIVSQIENGEVSLEQSIEKYAEGVELDKQCREILDAAEKKIQLLSRGADGSITQTGELEDDESDSASVG